MNDEAITHGEPLRFVDGTSLAVETRGGLVCLVTYDADGAHMCGVMLAPSEAQQIAQNVLAAAFTSKGHLGDESA